MCCTIQSGVVATIIEYDFSPPSPHLITRAPKPHKSRAMFTPYHGRQFGLYIVEVYIYLFVQRSQLAVLVVFLVVLVTAVAPIAVITVRGQCLLLPPILLFSTVII